MFSEKEWKSLVICIIFFVALDTSMRLTPKKCLVTVINHKQLLTKKNDLDNTIFSIHDYTNNYTQSHNLTVFYGQLHALYKHIAVFPI
jgi:hypothetical protein